MTQDLTAAVDAAMVEMQNISPPLRRSDCERLVRAALIAHKPLRGWVSVHEAMPRIGERCLIRIPVCGHFEIEGGTYRGDGDWLGAWCGSKGRNQTYKVSHWMEAPPLVGEQE